jgi:glyoxylase-like metal-dependent hydrolase (beta-lactamase superfamily II)
MAGMDRIRQLNRSWWLAQSRLYATNSGIFWAGGSACLIDPGIFPDELDALARFLEAYHLTVETIVLTHSHWDHIYGPERFPAAAVIASDRFTQTFRANEAVQRQAMRAAELEAGIDRPPLALPIPTETFEGYTTLPVGFDRLELLGAPGHAADQIAVYHQASGTLWAADMLSDAEIPYVSHNLAAYRRTLDTFARLDIRCLAPGHGAATTVLAEIQARLDGDRAYLDALQERIDLAVRSGKSLEETVAACQSVRFRQNAETNAGAHRRNVESAYVECGGQVDNPRIGWSQVD